MKNNFAFHHVRLAPYEQIESHIQSSWELSYVIIGSGKRLIGGESSHFTQSDLVLVPPGVAHVWYFNSDCVDDEGLIENISLMFTPELLHRLVDIFPCISHDLSALGALRDAVIFEEGVKEEIINRLQIIDRVPDREKIGNVINLISYLAANLTNAKTVARRRDYSAKQQKIKQVEIFVSCNYNRKIGIEDISRHLGMNKSSFCAFFRRVTGMTFVNYLNNYRLEQASYMLKTTWEPINSVAYSCGFQTVPHFNHLFKTRFGTSPKSMRKYL